MVGAVACLVLVAGMKYANEFGSNENDFLHFLIFLFEPDGKCGEGSVEHNEHGESINYKRKRKKGAGTL